MSKKTNVALAMLLESDTLETKVQAAEREAKVLTVTDDTTMHAALLFVSKCKESEKSLDADRRAQTDPLNEEIRRITEPYKQAIEAFKRLRTEIEVRMGEYRTRKQRELEAAQRKALEDAARKRAEEEAKAAAARAAADEARARGDEKVALKLEAKADKAEMAAATVVAPVVEQQAKTLTIDGSTVTLKTTKDWAYANGLQRGAKYTRDDSRFQALPDHLFVLDEAKIGQLVRAGARVPGILVFDKAGTAIRKC